MAGQVEVRIRREGERQLSYLLVIFLGVKQLDFAAAPLQCRFQRCPFPSSNLGNQPLPLSLLVGPVRVTGAKQGEIFFRRCCGIHFCACVRVV